MLYQETNSVGSNRFECIKYVNFRYVPHIHKHIEIVYVKHGTIDVCLESKHEYMRSGDFALILGNSVHSYYSTDSVAYVCVFSDDLVCKFARETEGKSACRAVFRCDGFTEKYVVDKLFLNANRDIFTIKSCLYAVCSSYLASVPLTDAGLGKNDELLHKILAYISEHYTENITLMQLADSLGYDRHYLSRYLHSNMKVGFCELVNSSRVDRARVLLNETDLTMAEIARQSGFQSVRNFNRIFKKYVGVVPKKV